MTGRPRNLCFLVGPPRSGTTWIQRLLQAHPAVCGGEESHFFAHVGGMLAASDTWSAIPDRPIGPLTYISRTGLEAALRDLWDRVFADLYARSPEAAVHLEKTPSHCFALREIVRLFPEAKIVFLVRDSRAVAASLLDAARSWGADWAPGTAKDAAIEWYRHVSAVRRWHADNPAHPLLTVRYEDAVADPRAALSAMLRFLLPEDVDLALDETLARFEAAAATARDPAGFARRRGTEGWRRDLSIRQKLVVWRHTRKEMRALGYPVRPF